MSRFREKMRQLGGYKVKESSYRSITREDIQTIEEQVGHDFPSSYRDFLTTYGGFGFENYVDFPFLDPYTRDDRGLITIFFDVMSGDSYDLMNNYLSHRNRMPSGFLPIASDPGGNVICLSLRKDDQGRVYFWDHEDEEMTSEGEEPGRSNVYLLGKSFDDFISSLEVSEDENDEELSSLICVSEALEHLAMSTHLSSPNFDQPYATMARTIFDMKLPIY